MKTIVTILMALVVMFGIVGVNAVENNVGGDTAGANFHAASFQGKIMALEAMFGIVGVNAVENNVGGDTAGANFHAASFQGKIVPLALGGDVFYIPALKIFASGNFPTTPAQLASGAENPLGSVTPNFGK